MVLNFIRRGFGGVTKGLRETRERARLSIAKMFGDKEARERLALIDRFKRETGFKYVDPNIYGYDRDNMEFLLDAWRKRRERLENIEDLLKERGIKLDPDQEEILKKLKKEALKDTTMARTLSISAKYLHDNRKTVAKASPLLNVDVKSRWGRYLTWMLLGRRFSDDIRSFVDGYKTARQGKMPFRGAGKYFSLYEDPEKLSMYKDIVSLIGGKQFAPVALHPSLHNAHGDPKRGAKLAELMAAMGEAIKGHNNLREIVEGESKAFEVVIDKLRKKYGDSLQDLPIEGRYSDRVKKVSELKGRWTEILKKHKVKDILGKLESDKKEEEYRKALNAAAEEFIGLLEGDQMVFGRLKEFVRNTHGWFREKVFGSGRDKAIGESSRVVKLSTGGEADIENYVPFEKLSKGGLRTGGKTDVENYVEYGELLPRKIHLKQVFSDIYSEIKKELPEHVRGDNTVHIPEQILFEATHKRLQNKYEIPEDLSVLHVNDEGAFNKIMDEIKNVVREHAVNASKNIGKGGVIRSEDLRNVIQEVSKKYNKDADFVEEYLIDMHAFSSQAEHHPKMIKEIENEIARVKTEYQKLADAQRALASHEIDQSAKELAVNALRSKMAELEERMAQLEGKRASAKNNQKQFQYIAKSMLNKNEYKTAKKIMDEAVRLYHERNAEAIGERVAKILGKHLVSGNIHFEKNG